MNEPDDNHDDAEEFELDQLAGEDNDEDEDDHDDTCPTCDGTGEGMYDGTRCRRCNGSGILRFPFDDYDPPEPPYCDEEGNRLP